MMKQNFFCISFDINFFEFLVIQNNEIYKWALVFFNELCRIMKIFNVHFLWWIFQFWFFFFLIFHHKLDHLFCSNNGHILIKSLYELSAGFGFLKDERLLLKISKHRICIIISYKMLPKKKGINRFWTFICIKININLISLYWIN